MTDALVRELREIVGEEFVVTDEASVATRARDTSGAMPQGDALAWVRPASTDEISRVLAATYAAEVPVVPQGALTGLAGAAGAVAGAVLLDLTRMDQVLAVDAVNRLAVVQPGVIVADFAELLAGQGLFYPPDPASAATATIGGTVATNAGGMRCIKYGVTRDYVRSLELVLADGTVLRTRPATRKSVTALDLTGLLVGSEGTLAVITEITVAVLPTPGPQRGVSASFASLADALAAAAVLAGSPRVPSTLELLDSVVMGAVRAFAPDAGLPEDAQAWVLAITDSHHDAEAELDQFTAVMNAHHAIRVERADNEARLHRLLRARRAFHGSMQALRGASLNEDISVLPSQLGEVAEAIARIAAEVGVEIGIGGHAGDGNLHPVVAYDPADPDQRAAALEAHRRILQLAPAFGGSLTGEHGIGTEKLGELGVEVGPELRGVQQAIKSALDPKGLLNPGRKL